MAALVASNETMLLDAAASGDIEKAKNALKDGANINCRDKVSEIIANRSRPRFLYVRGVLYPIGKAKAAARSCPEGPPRDADYVT